jgi:hypothetical protein
MSILGSLLGTNSNRPQPSDTMQKNAGGLMNRFNPLNLASGMSGKRKPGAADNYAGSSDGMKKGLKNKKDPRFVTKSVTPETPVQKGESVTDIAAKLFALFKGSFDEENKEEKIKKNSQKSMEAVRDKRNKELIAALTAEPKDLKKESKDLKKQEDRIKKDMPKQPAAQPSAVPKPGAQPPAAAAPKGPAPAQPSAAAPKGPAPAQPSTAAAPKGSPPAAAAPKGPTATPAGAPAAGASTATKVGAGAAVGIGALTYSERANAATNAFTELGLTNYDAIKALLQVASKESKLSGISEMGAKEWGATVQKRGAEYANKMFGGKNFTKEQYLDAAAKGDEYFFGPNFMKQYSGGWKYRGRGYIQITHDYNYKQISKIIGTDIYSDPDKLNSDPKINAKATLAYVATSIGRGSFEKGLTWLNTTKDPNKLLEIITGNVASGGLGTDEKRLEKLKKTAHYQENLKKAKSYEGAVASAVDTSGERLAKASGEGKDLKKETASAGGTVIVNQNNNIVATADKARTMTVPRSDGSRFVQGATT